jgi:hypothetical protein
VGTAPLNHCFGRFQQDSEIERQPGVSSELKIHANHFVEVAAASAVHLPNPSQARFDIENSSMVPRIVKSEFIRDRRSGTDERHVSLYDVQKARELIQAARAQESGKRG